MDEKTTVQTEQTIKKLLPGATLEVETTYRIKVTYKGKTETVTEPYYAAQTVWRLAEDS